MSQGCGTITGYTGMVYTFVSGKPVLISSTSMLYKVPSLMMTMHRFVRCNLISTMAYHFPNAIWFSSICSSFDEIYVSHNRCLCTFYKLSISTKNLTLQWYTHWQTDRFKERHVILLYTVEYVMEIICWNSSWVDMVGITARHLQTILLIKSFAPLTLYSLCLTLLGNARKIYYVHW